MLERNQSVNVVYCLQQHDLPILIRLKCEVFGPKTSALELIRADKEKFSVHLVSLSLLKKLGCEGLLWRRTLQFFLQVIWTI